MKPILYIFSGLPGAGKTTIASKMAKVLKLPYFRLDTIEHGLKNIFSVKVEGEGYWLTCRIAADNLRIGNDVIVDCVNPWELTRRKWEKTANDNNANYVNIEILCSDKVEHKRRIESRKSDISGLEMPTWEEVKKRDYQTWKEKRISIETYNKTINECIEELMKKIEIERKEFIKE